MVNLALITSDKVLIDSNIFIYTLDESIGHTEKVRLYLEGLFSSNLELFVSTQNILEIKRVVTHPTFEKKRIKVDIDRIINNWLKNITLIYGDEQVWYEYLELSQKYSVKGNQVFDLWLVATMKANNIKIIITANTKHFKKYRGITALDPLN